MMSRQQLIVQNVFSIFMDLMPGKIWSCDTYWCICYTNLLWRDRSQPSFLFQGGMEESLCRPGPEPLCGRLWCLTSTWKQDGVIVVKGFCHHQRQDWNISVVFNISFLEFHFKKFQKFISFVVIVLMFKWLKCWFKLVTKFIFDWFYWCLTDINKVTTVMRYQGS